MEPHTDPILKERFFGLTNAEGNHGEDVKEHYFECATRRLVISLTQLGGIWRDVLGLMGHLGI